MYRNTEKMTITSKELITSHIFEGMMQGIFFSLDKVNANYYVVILTKILQKKSISTIEYKNFVEILQDDEFQELLKQYSNTLNISEIMEILDVDNIVSLVKDETTNSLVSTLELEGEVGFRFQMRREVDFKLKTENYIVGLDENGNRIIYEILHIKTDWENVLRCGIRDKEGKVTKRGYLDEKGNNIYGGVSWFWISIKLDEKDGKKYLRVSETEDSDIISVDIEGKEVIFD